MSLLPESKSSTFTDRWLMSSHREGETFAYDWTVNANGTFSGKQIAYCFDLADFPVVDGVIEMDGTTMPSPDGTVRGFVKWQCRLGPPGTPEFEDGVQCEGRIVADVVAGREECEAATVKNIRIVDGVYFKISGSRQQLGTFTGRLLDRRDDSAGCAPV